MKLLEICVSIYWNYTVNSALVKYTNCKILITFSHFESSCKLITTSFIMQARQKEVQIS